MVDTSKKDGNSALIFGVPISGSSKAEVLKIVENWIDSNDGLGAKTANAKGNIRLIFTPNSEILVLSKRDTDFSRVLKEADINVADGVGLVIASKLYRLFGKVRSDQTISSSLPGVDLAHDLVMRSTEKGWRVFILGGRDGVAEEAGRMLEVEAKESEPTVSSGFAWSFGRPEDPDILRVVNEFKPDLLLVALGQGKQERWLVDHKNELNAKVGMVIGGAVDFWAGRVKRAPLWVRKIGLEWLYRLMREPWRWRRQLRLIEFGWLVFKEAIGV